MVISGISSFSLWYVSEIGFMIGLDSSIESGQLTQTCLSPLESSYPIRFPSLSFTLPSLLPLSVGLSVCLSW